ncbi:MAG: GNAT family N-acetyltransferase [Senegalia sp. (in: firmicutes)]|uniref:GNAT family N-acetyltransferase n=1 Tax=Senegalia sp. (in: firmicutes) TaxID=1924098 RepID=UPI003F955746
MENFDKIWDIYNSSFPEDEKRNLNLQKEILKDPRYKMKSLKDDEKVVGFITTWDMDDYLFVEHFAIDEKYRGKSYGKKFLKDLINKTDKNVVLEVELPDTKIAKRRIGFYERLNFKLNNYDYMQPAYAKDKEPMPLMIMTYPETIDKDEFNEVKDNLYNIVYSKID